MKQLICISILGVLGVLARFACDSYFTSLPPRPFPFSTLVVNLVGSFFIGVVYVLSVEKNALDKDLGAALMVGFLGGLTTFSSFSLQTLTLFQNGQIALALVYVTSSPLLGVLSAYAGMLLSRTILT